MGKLERKMIRKATRKHKKIFPCADKQDLRECFTQHENTLLFWFNTEDNSTHVLSLEVPGDYSY